MGKDIFNLKANVAAGTMAHRLGDVRAAAVSLHDEPISRLSALD